MKIQLRIIAKSVFAMEARNFQSAFIDLLRQSVPANIKLAEELSQLLGISADSAYRRIRGETDITLNEAMALCKHFDIPLERISHEQHNGVIFRINHLSEHHSSFTGYLDQLIEDLAWINRFENGEVIYAAEDLPVFYNFYFPLLARFKMAYWTKSIQNVTSMQGRKVEDVEIPPEWVQKAGQIGEMFLQLKSTDLWSEDSIKSVLRQITFYWEAGFFIEKSSALDVIDQLAGLIDMVQKQSEIGKKMIYSKQQFTSTDYTLYVSDLMIGNNCVFLKAQDKSASYIGYNSFNYMRTTNSTFNNEAYGWLQNLITKATLVSGVAEKARNQFFKNNFNQIEQLRKSVLES